MAANTRTNYATAEASLVRFLSFINVPIILPVDWHHICLWLSHLSYKLSHASIRSYLSGVATLHRDNGYDTPTDHHIVRRILDGIHREQTMRGVKQLRSLPMTPTLLDIMASSADMNDYDTYMMFAAMRLGTAALLRVGEFTLTNQPERILRMCNIKRTPGGYSIRLSITKTSKHGAGQTAFVGESATVAMMDTYIKKRAATSTNDILFVFANGTPLTRDKLLHLCRRWLQSIPVPPHRSVSFRAGGATSLNEAGVAAHTIKVLGRWESSAYERYVRQTEQQLLQQSSRLSSSLSSSSSSSSIMR